MSFAPRSVATDHEQGVQTAGIDAGRTIDDRTRRAATQAMAVVQEAPDLFTVYSGATDRYTVDTREGVCDGDDDFYRHPVGGCKHRRRVEMVLGERRIPFETVDVDPTLVHQFRRYQTRGPKGLGYAGGEA